MAGRLIRSVSLGALALASSAIAAPLAAQRARTPEPDSTAQARAEARAALARAQRELERTRDALRDQIERLDEDTSRAAREELRRLQLALVEAQRKANIEISRVMREEMARSMAQSEAQRATTVWLRSESGAPMPPMPMMPMVPTGYLGVVFSATPKVRVATPGEATMIFDNYPMIESVDPGSPAERAGIRREDRIVSIAGHDVTRTPVPLEQLLKPGAALPVRVVRDGEVRTYVVNVAPRPTSVVPSAAPMPAMPMMPPTPGTAPAAPSTPPPQGRMRVVVPSVRPPVNASSYWYLTGPTGLAGAELTAVTSELGDYFGVDHGLLVVRVGPGTPSERAGVRSGDVIVSADGSETRSVRALQLALERSTDRTVKLDLVRKKEHVAVTLSW